MNPDVEYRETANWDKAHLCACAFCGWVKRWWWWLGVRRLLLWKQEPRRGRTSLSNPRLRAATCRLPSAPPSSFCLASASRTAHNEGMMEREKRGREGEGEWKQQDRDRILKEDEGEEGKKKWEQECPSPLSSLWLRMRVNVPWQGRTSLLSAWDDCPLTSFTAAIGLVSHSAVSYCCHHMLVRVRQPIPSIGRTWTRNFGHLRCGLAKRRHRLGMYWDTLREFTCCGK